MGKGGENQHGSCPQHLLNWVKKPKATWILKSKVLGKLLCHFFSHFFPCPFFSLKWTLIFWLFTIHFLAFQEQLLSPFPNHRPIAPMRWAPFSFTPDYQKKRAYDPGLTNRIISSLGCSSWFKVRHMAQAWPKSAFGTLMGNVGKKKSFSCYWELPGITIRREITWKWSQHRGKQKRDGKSLNHSDIVKSWV